MEQITDILWKISWQVAVLAAVVWIITRLARKAPAAWRHALWVLVLVKFFIPPFAYVPTQLALGRAAPVTSTHVMVPEQHAGPHAVAIKDIQPSSPISTVDVQSVSEAAHNSDLLIVVAWGIGMFVCVLVLLSRYRKQKRMIHSALPMREDMPELIGTCAQLMQMKRSPLVRMSADVSTPVLVGLRRPTVLLPDRITESCNRSDLAAMLMHELAHVRRHDMLFVWLQQLAQMLFFWHPVVWLSGHEVKREREIACDEMVLSKGALPQNEYASGYVAALRLASDAPRTRISLAMAEPFEVEKNRVQLMLRAAMPKLTVRWITALAVLAAIGIPTYVGYALDSRYCQTSKPNVNPYGFRMYYKHPVRWRWHGLTFSVYGVGMDDRMAKMEGESSRFVLYTGFSETPWGNWTDTRCIAKQEVGAAVRVPILP